uniref:BMP and activin membrane-bound inhibitor homolog n=1 Tax=Sinocyclocheilus grahami TaxID=75366 RepID=A0A672RY43_SINGR
MQRNSSLVSIWLQLELCAMAVLLTKGEIRCYCDVPHCVATGYMCKSELNACFTRTLDPQSTKSPLSHGCYDPLLNSGKTCHPEYDTIHGSATLQCCHEDMCNYRGLQDVTYRGSEIHGTRMSILYQFFIYFSFCPQSDLSSQRLLSLVSWGKYSGRSKLEFV